MSDQTKLLDGKNQFYLENPQQALVIFQDICSKVAEINHEKDIFVYRSYIAQNKYSIPLSEIDPKSSSTDLKSVRLLAKYLSNSDKEVVLEELENLQNQNLDINDETSYIMWAIIYMNEKRFDQALKVLHCGSSLECLSFTVQCLLHIFRTDLAQKSLKKMVEINEDDVITQLTMAAVYLALGDTKLREAYNIYQELSEKYRINSSNLLLNGKATALIALQEFDEAETYLQEALTRNSNDAETIINMVVLTQAQGKSSEIVNRYLNQLRELHPQHSFVQDMNQKMEEFNRLSANYKVSIDTK